MILFFWSHLVGERGKGRALSSFRVLLTLEGCPAVLAQDPDSHPEAGEENYERDKDKIFTFPGL